MTNQIIKAALALLFFVHSFSVSAQDDDVKKKASEANVIKEVADTGWKKGGFFNTNISNTTFSNWAQGGTNNVAFIASTSLFAIYHKGVATWESYLDAAYGIVRNGKSRMDDPRTPGNVSDREIKNPFIKNEDKLVFLTKYGRKINDRFNYSALASLNTQLFPGYEAEDIFREKPIISNLMAQGFGYVSIGIDYKPTSYFSIYASPLTLKYTAVLDQRLADAGAYGVSGAEYDTTSGTAVRTKKGSQLRLELGCYLNLNFKKDIAKNINLQSRLELFNNYKTMGNIDVNWQNTLNMKVNKFVTVSLIHQMLYDDDIDTNPVEEGIQRRLQMKSFFGVGFSAKFGDKL
ncbi:MAG: DUF3078 domain-containing protein [Bacteroidia bacterium]|nr:DUF3078 domain-containing protein [Bacteroidia bacterium]